MSLADEIAVGILPTNHADVVRTGRQALGIAVDVEPAGAAAAAMAAHLAAPDPHPQYQLEALLVTVPIGGIIGWSGALSSCPPHYAVCNGIDNFPGPDLRSEFVV